METVKPLFKKIAFSNCVQLYRDGSVVRLDTLFGIPPESIAGHEITLIVHRVELMNGETLIGSYVPATTYVYITDAGELEEGGTITSPAGTCREFALMTGFERIDLTVQPGAYIWVENDNLITLIVWGEGLVPVTGD